jgi:hypothetical protein
VATEPGFSDHNFGQRLPIGSQVLAVAADVGFLRYGGDCRILSENRKVWQHSWPWCLVWFAEVVCGGDC